MADEVRYIRVHANGEWGSFYLREGTSGEGDRKNYWCELTCNTSFGVVGYYWGSMGGPAAWFLSKIDSHYLIGKLWGSAQTVFCGSDAFAQAKRTLLRERRERVLHKDEAREAYDRIWHVTSEFEWHEMVLGCDWLHRHLLEGGGPMGRVTNRQAFGFVERLWPDFLRQLSDVKQPELVHG